MNAYLTRLFYAQPDVARRLALLRVSLGVVLLVLVGLGPYGSFYTETASYLYRPGALLPFLPALPEEVWLVVRGIVLGAALCFLLGVGLRLVLPLLAASFFVLNYYVSRFADAQWSYNVHLNLFLVLLCFTRTDQRYALQKNALAYTPKEEEKGSLVLSVMQLYVAVLYFQTGLSKLLQGGVRWFTHGETIYTSAILLGGPRGAFFASYPWLSVLSGVFTGIFELGFLLAYLVGLNRRWLCVMAILFHTGTFLVLGISFWHLWLLYPALFWLDVKDRRLEPAV